MEIINNRTFELNIKKQLYLVLVLIIISSTFKMTNGSRLSTLETNARKIFINSQNSWRSDHQKPPNSSEFKESDNLLWKINQIESYSVIQIDGSYEFEVQATTNNWFGNGTKNSPYVIANLTITQTPEMYMAGIYIENSDVHFKIVNCTISDSRRGIYLRNTINGQFINNTISNMELSGIQVVNSDSNTFTGNTIATSRMGVQLYNSKKNNLTRNTFNSNVGQGISLDDSNENQIKGNNIITSSNGLYLYNAQKNIIRDNTLVNADFKMEGDQVEDYIQEMVINNSVNGKKLLYWLNITGEPVPDNSSLIYLVNCNSIEVTGQLSSGIQNVNCTNISIHDNNIMNAGRGILLIESRNVTVRNNNIARNSYGVEIRQSREILLENNIIIDSLEGINLKGLQNGLFVSNTVIDSIRGIICSQSSNISFSDNLITNNRDQGLNIVATMNTSLIYNTVTNNGNYGIRLASAWNCTITGNYITNNEQIGIYLDHAPNNVLKENSLVNNHLEIKGLTLEDYLQKEVVNNTINGKNLVFWQNITRKTIPNGAGQIILVNCNTVKVVNQKIEGASLAVHSIYCTDLYFGNNTVTNGRIGILLDSTEIGTITDNIILSNTEAGIALYSSSRYLIQGNKISYCGRGIHLDTAWNNNLINNTITNNVDSGIYLNDAWNTIVRDNEFTRNWGYGLLIDSVTEYGRTTGTDNNTVMWNRFYNNNYNRFDIHQAKDDGKNNEITHNYWSDWTAPDWNENGIVDFPYSLDGVADNEDPYPHVFSTFVTNNPDNVTELVVSIVILGFVVILFRFFYQRLTKTH